MLTLQTTIVYVNSRRLILISDNLSFILPVFSTGGGKKATPCTITSFLCLSEIDEVRDLSPAYVMIVLMFIVSTGLCVLLFFLRRASRVGERVIDIFVLFLGDLHISHTIDLCVLVLFGFICFFQMYSFDLQFPDPIINQFSEPTGTFEPVYLDDLGVCVCVCVWCVCVCVWCVCVCVCACVCVCV